MVLLGCCGVVWLLAWWSGVVVGVVEWCGSVVVMLWSDVV